MQMGEVSLLWQREKERELVGKNPRLQCSSKKILAKAMASPLAAVGGQRSLVSPKPGPSKHPGEAQTPASTATDFRELSCPWACHAPRSQSSGTCIFMSSTEASSEWKARGSERVAAPGRGGFTLPALWGTV